MYHSGIRPISSITGQANPNKYQILVIAPHLDDTSDTCTLKIENQQIKPNGNLKIPGNMDSELYFRDHISDICKTASQKVGVLMRLRNVIPRRPTPFISICSTFAFDVPSDRLALYLILSF